MLSDLLKAEVAGRKPARGGYHMGYIARRPTAAQNCLGNVDDGRLVGPVVANAS